MAKHSHVSIRRARAPGSLRTWASVLLLSTFHHSSLGEAPTAAVVAGTPATGAPKGGDEKVDGATEPAKSPSVPNKPANVRLREDADKLLASIKAPPTPITISVKGREVISFWSPDLSGKPVGAVLMLHDNAESPRKPDTLFKLHRVLPKFGWATLSIQLPQMPPNTIPIRTRPPTEALAAKPAEGAAQTEPKQEAAPAKVDETKVVFQDEEAKAAEATKSKAEPVVPIVSDEEVVQMTMARLQAAIDYLQQQKQYNIVILGEGFGAVLALKFAGQAQVGAPPATNDNGTAKEALVDRPIRALILLNADFNERGADTPTKMLRYPNIPTLDLITSVDADERVGAQERAQISKKNRYETYISRTLTPLYRDTSDDQEDLVTKSIRGFLTQHARGVVL